MVLCMCTFTHAQSTCSAFCDIYFDGTGNALGCTDETASGCTKCFAQIYTLVSTTCVLRAGSTYNSSSEIFFGSFVASTPGLINSATYSTKTFYQFEGATASSLNYTILSTNAHYRIRFRFWVYYQSPGNNQMYFTLNITLQNTSLNRPLAEDSRDTWIINTDPLNYIENVILLTFFRTENHGSNTGIDDLIIIVQECVVGCTSCTSLNDCRECAGGLYLNEETKLCMADCGHGMFEDGTICTKCDEKCLTCDGTSTNCFNCTD